MAPDTLRGDAIWLARSADGVVARIPASCVPLIPLVPGPYAVGSCAATTTFGSGYSSGFALGRGLTFAYLGAAEVGLSAVGPGGQAFLPPLNAPG